MKRATQFLTTTAAALCLTCTTAAAQPPATQDGVRSGAANASRLDSKTRGSNIRASQLLGLNIQNPQGESLGEINDLVINATTGKIRYAAVTYGGFLGMGDKLFAVPFEAFKVQVDPEDRDDYVMVLDVTQKQLDGQQGFDQDNWPNMGDRQWAMDLDKRYGVERKTPANNRARRTNQ
ncbi:PRC-barrel domain-containing protein [Allorhodopirellula heiligendammensis]|uniref:PRC-barrel domain protein n=1 Tax=Allorhodopirellula heiligendammensis TaxID=2714739 RepID=A0A5C6BY04_9BACT|nr:PRC-barrel domain-containing protein [Allorhodopirellula heiligendammensis]TWU16537.1 PRC-barrel domain protein [Allorhodopirellula heiligendammensis]